MSTSLARRAAGARRLISAVVGVPDIGPTLCAWCQAEGVRTVLADGDPHGPVSHGICQRHAAEFDARGGALAIAEGGHG